MPLAVKLVTEQGRMKFVRPIYRDLYAWTDMRKVHFSDRQTQVVLETCLSCAPRYLSDAGISLEPFCKFFLHIF